MYAPERVSVIIQSIFTLPGSPYTDGQDYTRTFTFMLTFFCKVPFPQLQILRKCTQNNKINLNVV